MWRSDPIAVAAQQAAIEAEYGDRSLIGIGAGHPEATSDYARPRHAMIEFLDRLDAAPAPLPADQRVLAALGPRMLDLAGERALGSHPYFTNVEHTRFARDRLGSGRLLAPELACVVDPDPERARASAREYAATYLGLSNYTNNLLHFGFTEADLADGGSDRLIDAVIPHGSAEDIAAVVHAHLEAGADHVCVQPVGVSGVPREEWTALARALGL
jgi:probable F420-dependent oxidoreductase